MSGWRSCSSAFRAACWGFLLAVNLLVFILGCFLDFFEIAFIVVPLLAPVASALGIDLVWFGVIIAMNLQTSFLTPPFGFALFYMRSVAPARAYADKVTGRTIAGVSTAQIYRGAASFIVLQVDHDRGGGHVPGPRHQRAAAAGRSRHHRHPDPGNRARTAAKATAASRRRRHSTEPASELLLALLRHHEVVEGRLRNLLPEIAIGAEGHHANHGSS